MGEGKPILTSGMDSLACEASEASIMVFEKFTAWTFSIKLEMLLYKAPNPRIKITL